MINPCGYRLLCANRIMVPSPHPEVRPGRHTHSSLPAENSYNNPGFSFLCHKGRNMEGRRMAVILILKGKKKPNSFLNLLPNLLNTITPFGHLELLLQMLQKNKQLRKSRAFMEGTSLACMKPCAQWLALGKTSPMPVIAVSGRWRRKDPKFKVILGSEG